MGAISGLSTPSDSGVSIPETDTVEFAFADTELSYSFPVNTKQFKIFNDGRYLSKLSYQFGESGINFYPIYPGDEHSVYGISAPSVTIYLQATGLTTLRLEIWR